MKRNKILQLLVFLILSVTLSGCYDKLGTVDLSGKVELIAANNGWAYRVISSNTINKSWLLPSSRLTDYRHLLELKKQIYIGENEYCIVTKFEPNFSFFDYYIDSKNSVYHGFQSKIYSFTANQVIEPFVTRQSDSGDSWNASIGFFKPTRKTKELSRRGVFEVLFNEPSIDKDCIISSDYSISSYAERKVDKEGNLKKDFNSNAFKKISLNGSSRIKIGLRQCLTGTLTVAEKTFRLYILDWDLDGKFTEADRVWSDYIKQALPFGAEIRLTNSMEKSRDNTYILRLENPSEDNYILDIQLYSEGKN